MFMEDRNQLEAQFWWAFACLVLAGRRESVEFHEELLRRGDGIYPSTNEVHRILDEASCHLSVVLNASLSDPAQQEKRRLSGWRRHLLALASSPEHFSPL
jgi:hypothetical protein